MAKPSEDAVDLEFFTNMGFDDKTKKQIAKNAEMAAKIKDVYQQNKFSESSPEKSALIYTICSSPNPDFADKLVDLGQMVFEGKLASKQQLKLAETYFADHKFDFDQADFDKFCGVGVVITDKDILDYVAKFVTDNLEKLQKVEYKANHPEVFALLKDGLPLANPATILKIATDYIKEKFADQLKDAAAAPKDKKKKKEEIQEKEQDVSLDDFQKVDITKLVARDMAESVNDAETLKKHKEQFGDKIITRFPPEPNGILHIGHCRAIRFNFSIAGLYKGECNLRYDDTNPEKEKKEYMDMIEQNVAWMGFKPARVVHASHYFPQIFDWTLELIKMGKAFVCKLPVETMRKYKEDGTPSPYRDTAPEENLREFQLMKRGYYAEGEAVLRAKIDYTSKNMCMRDPVIYRIIYTPHPVAGSDWCIYPLYDYTHPLSDCIEGITHSCCTLEFETRRDLYYWPLKELGLYKPYVWEFSRLNMTYALTSKRKILQLMGDNIVKGWDDPRLFTIDGLRRRGISLEALNEFLDRVPVTRKGNDNFIQLALFDHVCKQIFDKSCPRQLAVADPVTIEITDMKKDEVVSIEAPNFPNDPSKGTYQVNLSNHVLVEKKDVRTQDEKNFFGIAPNKVIRLKYGPAIKITSVVKAGNTFEIKAERVSDEEVSKLPTIKGVLNWISKRDALKCEFRLYERLFDVEKPTLAGEDLAERKKELNPNSLTVCLNAVVNKNIVKGLTKESRFQFERLGFFCVDLDSNFEKGKYVFNRILQSQTKLK